MSKELADVLGESARARQFTFMGDTSHKKIEVLQAVAQPENMAALKAAGVKHLFLEVPQDMQRSLDGYLSGKISERKFLEDLERKHPRALEAEAGDRAMNTELLKLARLASEAGLHVHCADHRSALFRSMRGEYEEYAQRGGMVTFEDFLKAKHTSNMPDGSKVTPLTDDRPLAKFIAEQARGEKAAIFYGAGHGQTSYGLDEILGEDRVNRIDIYTSKPWAVTRLIDRFVLPGDDFGLDKDKPYADYYADTGQVERYPAKPEADLVMGDVNLRRLAESREHLEGGLGQTRPTQRPERPPPRSPRPEGR